MTQPNELTDHELHQLGVAEGRASLAHLVKRDGGADYVPYDYALIACGNAYVQGRRAEASWSRLEWHDGAPEDLHAGLIIESRCPDGSLLRELVGNINSQNGGCSCCGGTQIDTIVRWAMIPEALLLAWGLVESEPAAEAPPTPTAFVPADVKFSAWLSAGATCVWVNGATAGWARFDGARAIANADGHITQDDVEADVFERLWAARAYRL